MALWDKLSAAGGVMGGAARSAWAANPMLRRAGYGALGGAGWGALSGDTSVLGGAFMGAALAGPGLNIGRRGLATGMAGYRAGGGAGQIASLTFQGMGRESLAMLSGGMTAASGFGRTMTQAYNAFRAMK